MFTLSQVRFDRARPPLRGALLSCAGLASNALGAEGSSGISSQFLTSHSVYARRFSVGDGASVLSGLFRSWSGHDAAILAIVFIILTLVAIVDFFLRRRARTRAAVMLRLTTLASVASELSVRLSSCPPEQVDMEIARGLDRILATKKADHVAWSVFAEDGSGLQQTHFAHRPGIPPWPLFSPEEEIPWFMGHLRRGEAVIIASVERLPAESAADQLYLKQQGVKSIALVPTTSGDEVKAVLTLVYRTVQPEWPPELISHLQLVASILANTLSGKRAREARQNSEERFRHLFESASVGMALEDMEGRLLFVNPALSSILGYANDELRGMNCSEFADLEDEQEDFALFQQLTAGQIPSYEIEKRYRRKDGARIWGRLHVSLLRSNASDRPLIVAMVADISERKKAEEELQSAKNELQHLAARLIRVQEEEKQRIARELHDDFGQRLSMVAMELDLMIQEQPIVHSAHRGRLVNVLEQVGELASDVHGLSHRLHSSKLQHLGLGPALADLCRQLSGTGFKVTLDVDDGGGPVPPETAMCLYRVAQEALNNAMKHSGASQAVVRLVRRHGALRLTVNDGGIGFDVKNASGGLGLASMRERLRVLDGKLLVVSHPGDGTELVADVPAGNWVPQAKAS